MNHPLQKLYECIDLATDVFNEVRTNNLSPLLRDLDNEKLTLETEMVLKNMLYEIERNIQKDLKKNEGLQ